VSEFGINLIIFVVLLVLWIRSGERGRYAIPGGFCAAAVLEVAIRGTDMGWLEHQPFPIPVYIGMGIFGAAINFWWMWKAIQQKHRESRKTRSIVAVPGYRISRICLTSSDSSEQERTG
jgi:hypothetical protein